jgi:ubiquinol-cytochrome c reductase iron-sulfur subunit
MTNSSTISADAPSRPAPTRRDFLYVATAAVAGVGAAATLWPFIDQMNPDADTAAAAAPIDIDVSQIQPGQQIVVLWTGRPLFIVNRTKAALESLQEPALVARLSDPDSTALQQPPYAVNWHRSVNPEFLVLVGICTHLGCVPTYAPKPDPTDPAPNWPGGYLCHCHGSKYDLAGRVFLGVPAPYNLPVPPHHFPDGKTLRVGENPPGSNFDFNAILQV